MSYEEEDTCHRAEGLVGHLVPQFHQLILCCKDTNKRTHTNAHTHTHTHTQFHNIIVEMSGANAKKGHGEKKHD